MRITTLARRSVATLAATALLTTGGAALGLTSGVANAQTVSGISRVGGGAAIGVNNGVNGFQANGTDFMPSGQEKVTLTPHSPITGQGSVNGVVRDNSAQCTKTLGTVLPDAHCEGPLLFDANLSGVAVGVYDVFVTQSPQTGLTNTDETDPCYSCITVVSPGPATTTGVAPSGTSNGPLTITGTNFANGARVEFYATDGAGNPTAIDPMMHFTAISRPNTTTINGNYSADLGAVGKKIIRVLNLDEPSGPGPGAVFYQPRVTGVSPSTLGQGATGYIVSVDGGGFEASSTVAWSDPKVTASGPIALTASGFTVPTSVASDTTPGSKTLTVKNRGGGFTTFGNALTVTAGPKPTSVTPRTRGQNSTSIVTVAGSGFTPTTAFAFGQGITATTNSVNVPGTSAQVTVVVLPDADLGARTLTATNADKGTATLPNAFTVVAKPVIVQITPPSGGPSASVPVTLTGHDFDTSGVTVSISGSNITVGPVTVDSPTQIRTTFNAAGAAPGPRDVSVINNATGGTSTCTGCYGINSMTVAPSSGTNTGSKTLTFTGSGLNNNSIMKLMIPGSQDYQAPITGTNVACGTPATNQVCSTFDLTNVATGRYTAVGETGNTLTCTGCFQVSAVVDPAPVSAAPNAGGQGAVDRRIVITGSNFSPGEDVIFTGSGVSVSHVTFNSTTQLTAIISIAENAAPGARGFAVKNIGDGRSGSTSASAFTVVAGPKTTATDVHQLGQNAVADVTLTGSGYQPSAVANFGPGTSATTKSVTATTLVATVTVSDTADTASIRDIRVTNPTDGGTGTLVGQFKISPAPRISSIDPGFGKPGETKSVVISGSGFATSPVTPTTNTSPTTCPGGSTPAVTCPTVIVAGLLATVKTVSVDGTSMTADFAIGSSSPISNPAAKVVNPDRGQSVKLAAFRIATVPVAPINVAAAIQGTTATVTWAFPTTANADGGSPLTGFIVDDGDASTNNTQTVGPDVRSATFSGLTAGKVYTFTVKAANAVGVGPAGTTGTTQFVTSLTSRASKLIATAGDLIHYTGKLTRTADGSGAPNAAILVTLDPDTGPTRQFTTYTNSIGVWGFRFMTYYNMTVSAKFVGNATDKASSARIYRLGTFLRIVKKTPGNAARVNSGGFHVTGYANFATAGRVAYLVRGNGALVTRTTIRSDRTFDFTARLPRGVYYLQVTMAAGGGNLKSGSALFQVNSQ